MNEEDDLRSTLEAAMNTTETPSGEASGGSTGIDPPAESSTATETPPAASATPSTAAPTPAPATPAPPAAAANPEQPPATDPNKPSPLAPSPNDPDAKAPGSWTPTAREKWATLPAEVRSEVWKREREASRALTMSNEARKFTQQFEQTMQPYLGFIAAEGSTPLAAVNNMMQTAAALRVGTPQQKVQIAAEIIRNFGIDLQALDSVLAGQQPQFNPQVQLDQMLSQKLAPVMQMVQQQQLYAQQQTQQLQSTAESEIETFANDPKNEFYWDVKDTMADLIEVASRRGMQMGLTEAYERATLMHEPVRRVIEARKQRESAQQLTNQARQARGSAVSVTPSAEIGNSVPVVGDSIRASIEAAFNAQQGR